MKTSGCKRNRVFRSKRRRGAAVVELAVVTPLLLTMLFGIMEFGRVFMVSETLNTAAREACRVGIVQGSTSTDIEARFDQSTAALGDVVSFSDVTVVEDVPTGADYTVVTVTVQIPYNNVSLFGNYLGLDTTTLGASCSMRKEGT